MNIKVSAAALVVTASMAGAQQSQVYTCELAPPSQHKSEFPMKFRLTIAPDGAAKLEGVKNDGLRVSDRPNKVNMNWTYRDYRFSSSINKKTMKSTVGLKQ
ncbi:MAG: hypothetical protein ACU0AZ_07365 [Paracoccaceae bacterium]